VLAKVKNGGQLLQNSIQNSHCFRGRSHLEIIAELLIYQGTKI